MVNKLLYDKSNRISRMIKFIIGLLFVACLASYDGVYTYKDVETLSDLGSLILIEMTAIVLIAFGIDEMRR